MRYDIRKIYGLAGSPIFYQFIKKVRLILSSFDQYIDQ